MNTRTERRGPADNHCSCSPSVSSSLGLRCDGRQHRLSTGQVQMHQAAHLYDRSHISTRDFHCHVESRRATPLNSDRHLAQSWCKTASGINLHARKMASHSLRGGVLHKQGRNQSPGFSSAAPGPPENRSQTAILSGLEGYPGDDAKRRRVLRLPLLRALAGSCSLAANATYVDAMPDIPSIRIVAIQGRGLRCPYTPKPSLQIRVPDRT